MQLAAVESPYCTDNAWRTSRTSFHADLMRAICNHHPLSMVAMHVWKTHLLHVVEVLHAGRFAQIDPMCNVLAQHESANQVICIASLSCKNYTYHSSLTCLASGNVHWLLNTIAIIADTGVLSAARHNCSGGSPNHNRQKLMPSTAEMHCPQATAMPGQ